MSTFVDTLRKSIKKWTIPIQRKSIWYWGKDGKAAQHHYPIKGSHDCTVPGCPASSKK